MKSLIIAAAWMAGFALCGYCEPAAQISAKAGKLVDPSIPVNSKNYGTYLQCLEQFSGTPAVAKTCANLIQGGKSGTGSPPDEAAADVKISDKAKKLIDRSIPASSRNYGLYLKCLEALKDVPFAPGGCSALVPDRNSGKTAQKPAQKPVKQPEAAQSSTNASKSGSGDNSPGYQQCLQQFKNLAAMRSSCENLRKK